jgi:D-tyrosyl-tRNA(Tyr) deacylase
VVQRVAGASVTVDDEVVGAIDGPGLLVLVGITHDDGPAQAAWLARKLVGLRIMRDERSVADLGAPVLVVSQFTLYGDARKGRRPSFVKAMAPGPAEQLYEKFVAAARATGISVATGRFRAMMHVELVNDGPVTLLLDSKRQF